MQIHLRRFASLAFMSVTRGANNGMWQSDLCDWQSVKRIRRYWLGDANGQFWTLSAITSKLVHFRESFKILSSTSKFYHVKTNFILHNQFVFLYKQIFGFLKFQTVKKKFNEKKAKVRFELATPSVRV